MYIYSNSKQIEHIFCIAQYYLSIYYIYIYIHTMFNINTDGDAY